MSKYRFAIFYSIIIVAYLFVNEYVFSYGWSALGNYPNLRLVYAALFWLIAPMFIAARIAERYFKNKFVSLLLWIGSFWLAMLTYLVLGISGVYLGLLVASRFGVDWYGVHQAFQLLIGTGLGFASFLLSASGWKNARHPAIRKLQYVFPKGSGAGGEFHFVAASDIHLGTIIGKKRFGRFVHDVNALHPDAIFLVGDTIDEDIEPVIRQDIGSSIRKLHAPLGVFGVNGNHEHIGGVERADAYLEEHGVTLLRDQSKVIGNAFVLMGREDSSSPIFTGIPRATLDELVSAAAPDLPIILLDHQPGSIPETVRNGHVALQLSGHTHHGQLWPFGFITNRIFEISWGGKKIGNTEFYVSSGWGTWGPPVRTGNVPEILDIRIRFE